MFLLPGLNCVLPSFLLISLQGRGHAVRPFLSKVTENRFLLMLLVTEEGRGDFHFIWVPLLALEETMMAQGVKNLLVMW